MEPFMSLLCSPISVRSLSLPNRIVVSPMCQYVAEDGRAMAWHLIHLGSMALSGAGLLCIEATAVEADGRITAGDLGLWDDASEAALQRVLAPIRQLSKISVALQLGHAGRKLRGAGTQPQRFANLRSPILETMVLRSGDVLVSL
jgi:2,4-dienoyl-CoA reductase-like NADH-dependent reductase (Old Yellow Enzyme family)